MWEENNNADARKGARFYFTLPIVSKEQHSDNYMIVYESNLAYEINCALSVNGSRN